MKHSLFRHRFAAVWVAVLMCLAGCTTDETIASTVDTQSATGVDVAADRGVRDAGTGEDSGTSSDFGDGETNPEDAEPDSSAAPDTFSPADVTDTSELDQADAPDDEEEPPPPAVVRFVAFGDWGVGAISQIERAADAMRAHCETHGCDFALTLGDNFYDNGVTGLDDPQWEDKFEEPFADWTIPIYPTLGNHDHLGDIEAQWAYSDRSDIWTMPDRFYEIDAAPAQFFALDTDILHRDAEQWAWLFPAVRQSTAPWRIAFGHHPWRSNGSHGDADEGLAQVYEFALCNELDLMISGHEHDLQRLLPECGTQLVISGKPVNGGRSVGHEDNTLFASEEVGFAWFEVYSDRIVLEIRAIDGRLLYEDVIEPANRIVECGTDGYCELACSADPDCEMYDLACASDGECESRCSYDPDCFDDCDCDYNTGVCEPLENPSTVRCGCDPMCRGGAEPCVAEGHCDTWCPEGVDPDCD